MPGKRKVTVEILGDDRDLKRALGSTDKAAGKWSGKMSKLGKAAGLGLAAGLGIGLAVGVDVVKAAIEDEASQAKLAQTLKKTQGARKADIDGVEKWIDATSRASGVADDELRPALSKLLIAGEDAAQAQKDVALAMDVSAATGKPLAAVTAAMAKAHNGNTAALGKLGVKTKDASGKALTYQQIQKNLAKQMGGASAAAADTTAGKMKRLGVAFQEAKESLGAKLLPVLLKLGDWILKTGIPALGRIGDWINTHIMPAFRAFGGYIAATVVPVLQKIGHSLAEQLGPKIDKVKGAFVQIHPQLVAFGHVIKAIATFVITKLLPIYAKLEGFILGKLLDAVVIIIRAFGLLVTAIGAIYLKVRDVVRNIHEKWNSMVTTIKGLPHKIASAASGMWDGIKDAFKAALNWIIDRWNGLEFTLPSIDAFGKHIGGATIGVPDIPRFAKGTSNAPPGLAWVGEYGPELVRMRGGEQVIPAGQSAALAGNGGGTTYILDMRGAQFLAGPGAVVAEVQKYVRQKGRGDVQVLAGSRV